MEEENEINSMNKIQIIPMIGEYIMQVQIYEGGRYTKIITALIKSFHSSRDGEREGGEREKI